VTTEGHRDILELRRGNRPIVCDLRYERDPVLIERDMCFELAERIASDGTILTPLDETALDEVARNLAALGVKAVSVSFLNAYANPIHEDRAAAQLRAALPGVYVTAGTELSREWYEYERTAAAVAVATAIRCCASPSALPETCARVISAVMPRVTCTESCSTSRATSASKKPHVSVPSLLKYREKVECDLMPVSFA